MYIHTILISLFLLMAKAAICNLTYCSDPNLSFWVKSQYFNYKSEQQITSRTMCSPVKSHLPVSELDG